MSLASAFVSYLVNAAWQVTVIAAVGWLATRLLKKLGPQAEHRGWIVTWAIAIATPAIPFLGIVFSLWRRQTSVSGRIFMATGTGPDAGSGSAGFCHLPMPVIWSLAALYLGVAFYFAVRFAGSVYRMRAIAQRAQPLKLTLQQQEIWSRCKQLFSIEQARILSSCDVRGPVVLGVRKPLLLLPSEFALRCTAPDFLTALAHECAHVQRRDFQKNLFYEAASLVLAFHPAMWAIKARMAQTREMICDRLAAERVIEPRAYARSLLRLAAIIAGSPRAAGVHAIGIFDANILEKRIMMISTNTRRSGRVARFGMTALALLLLSAAGITSAAKAVAVEAQTTSSTAGRVGQTSPYGPIYKTGNGVSAPVMIHSIEAKFPASANAKDSKGVIVLVGIIVDQEGVPRDVHVIRMSSASPDFGKEAVKAVEQYRFKPAQKAGSPVAVAVTVEINFKKY